MGVSRSDIKTRNRYLDDARRASFQDAVFFVYYYNSEVKRWGPPTKPPDITPAEVFPGIEKDLYQQAEARARKLREDGVEVGRAYFQYSGARPYQEQLAAFRAGNPGYCERCYELAIEAGIRDMR